MFPRFPLSRRQAIARTIAATSSLYVPGVFAEQLATAPMTEGPYYPDKFPLDTDNDLLLLNDSITPAVGEVTHLQGVVLTRSGQPVRNAFIEIWQVDNNGVYIHSADGGKRKDELDANFQGYGRCLTNAKGEYYFRTIKPVPYGAGRVRRTPHVHFGISLGGKRIFTTQMLVDGHPQNEGDILFNRIEDPAARKTLLVDFKPIEGSPIGELSARFDIVLDHTVEEVGDGTLRGLGKPLGGRAGRRPR